MFKVFISASSLEKMCLNEMTKSRDEQSSWFLVLSNQRIIYLDKNVYEDWDYDDPLFTFSESYGVDLQPATANFNETCSDTPVKLLNEPQTAFLLDVDQETAKSITEQYGVLCQSTNDLSKCPLDIIERKRTFSEGEKTNTWEMLFERVKNLPSNTLIIVDRYIFSYDNKHHSNCIDGLENIKKILKSVLPKTLSCEYHVLIMFDSSRECNIDNRFNIVEFAKKLDYFKNNVLKRPYPILIELYSVSRKCSHYDATHNRRIISNYFMGFADHMIKAVHSEGEAICDQDIRLESVYSHGLHDDSDPAVKALNKLVKGLRLLHKDAIKEVKTNGENAHEYNVICGIDEKTGVRDVRNRIIVT